ncbi:MAG: FAD-dependent oxidoreductase [Oligoflexia bacterium]|nr:FAD-dependent oxidoreductase [Oligoflexia bacterium]
MKEDVMELDTAVIGGGITGLYACLQLRKRLGPSHKIALFESSTRLGGRIETVEMDGFLAEYGPMRFEKKAQPLLMNLIQELELDIVDFCPYRAATDPESLFQLTEGEDLWTTTTGPSYNSYERMPFDTLELLTLGILRILQESNGDLNNPNDPLHWQWWKGLDESDYNRIRTTKLFREKPLHTLGLWNALSMVLSHRALTKILHYGTFYHVIHHNPNAAEWIIFWLRGLHPDERLVGIKQGSEALITQLQKKLSSPEFPPIPIHLQHSLISLKQHNNKQHNNKQHLELQLSTPSGETEGSSITVHCRDVVLALPQCPLKKLSQFFPGPIRMLINSVIPIPLFKCFFVTKNPWWDQQTPSQTRASSVPSREIHYYYREEGDQKLGMVMVYGDFPSLNYWRHFVARSPQLSAEINLNEQLRECFDLYLRSSSLPSFIQNDSMNVIMGIKDKDDLTCFGIRDWSYGPFKAGCHVWKPMIKVKDAIATLEGFSLTGAQESTKNLHICGEAYSDFQGFIEGGLRNALEVVDQISISKSK